MGASIKFRDLAERAGLPGPTLSFYISGRTRAYRKQVLIWEAFCELSRLRPTLKQFWGELLSERVA